MGEESRMLAQFEKQSEKPLVITDKDYTEDNKTVNRVIKFTFIREGSLN